MAVLTDELLQFAEGIVERVAHQRMNWVAIGIIFYSSFDAYHFVICRHLHIVRCRDYLCKTLHYSIALRGVFAHISRHGIVAVVPKVEIYIFAYIAYCDTPLEALHQLCPDVILHSVERDIILGRFTCFLGRGLLLNACSCWSLQTVPLFSLVHRETLILAYCLNKGCAECLLFMNAHS